MAERDTIDFVTAFAVGIVLGVGAALLLKPEPPTRTARILKELEPHRKRIRKSLTEARRGFGQGAGAAADVGAEIAAAGKELVQELRAEFSRLVADARRELARAAEEEARRAVDRRVVRAERI